MKNGSFLGENRITANHHLGLLLISQNNYILGPYSHCIANAMNSIDNNSFQKRYLLIPRPHISDSGSCVLGMDHITLQITLSVGEVTSSNCFYQTVMASFRLVEVECNKNTFLNCSLYKQSV